MNVENRGIIPNQEDQYSYMYREVNRIVENYNQSIQEIKKPGKEFEALKDKYIEFYNAIKTWHKESPRPHRGHGLDHDVTVAQLSLKIAPDEKTGELAWISSLLHSVDRTLERGNSELVSSKLNELIKLGSRLAKH